MVLSSLFFIYFYFILHECILGLTLRLSAVSLLNKLLQVTPRRLLLLRPCPRTAASCQTVPCLHFTAYGPRLLDIDIYLCLLVCLFARVSLCMFFCVYAYMACIYILRPDSLIDL